MLLVLAIGLVLHRQAVRGPLYEGRHIADWVDEALRGEGGKETCETVLKIGAPAVPFIARQGFYGRSHMFNFSSSDWVNYFGGRHPRLRRWLDLEDWDFCVSRHMKANNLLWLMSTNAQAAIPDVINCLERCPELHYVNSLDLLDTLGEICGTNPAAIPYLTRCARSDHWINFRAATIAYYIDGKTNLFVETCERIARKEPKHFASEPELFWFRDDHALNKHIVPLLEKNYFDAQLDASDRESVMFELTSRSNDATAAIARILARQTNAPASLKP